MYRHTPSCQIKTLPKIYFDTFGITYDGTFVDVGAFNGINWSNTRCLGEAGWRGLLIEPQKEYLDHCRKIYHHHINMLFDQCCVGKENGTTKLYLGGSNTTIKSKMVDIYNDTEWAKFSGLRKDRCIEVDIFTLDTLLVRHQIPVGFEVLDIDVEGAEIDVLKGFNIEYWQPELVIVEAHEQNEDKRLARKARWINTYFYKYGYTKIYSDAINNIYRIT